MAWFDEAGLSAAVIGGVAAGLQGKPRLTQDVGVVVMNEDAGRLLQSASEYGFGARIPDALEFSHRTRVLLLRHRSGIDVDVSLGGLPFEAEVVDRSERVDVGGLALNIASPEDLIIMKALARRPQDVADIEGILDVQANIDADLIRRWIREFSSVLEMPGILEELEKLLKRRSL